MLPAYGQQTNTTPVPLSVQQPVDSQSVAQPNDTTQKKQERFDAEITYSATDSIVFFGDGTGFLYGGTDVNYKEMNLREANLVRIKMDSSMIYAYGKVDSTGVLTDKPIFKDEESEYTSNEITYNFRSKRGYVRQAVTQQGDGFIISKRTKIIDNNILNIAEGKYTTCDLHDHPHFYLGLAKAKVKPGEYIVTGPANLVILDIPVPVALPFGFFPFNTNYSSGIEMPSFETEFTRGYGLTNGGYYFAINDFMDLSLKGDIYTKGTWGVVAQSNYLKR